MASFHRKTTPTYPGGLPGTHDYINNPSANGDPGSAAPADAKKSSGVNQGTYLIAFGEAATAGNSNRGTTALAENTDYLDNILHQDVSEPVVAASVTSGSPTTGFVITGSVFVGGGTATNDQRTRSGLVAILDGNGLPLTVLSGGSYVTVKASLIHDGSNNNVVGTGYRTNPSVTLSIAIPASTAYRYVYYKRSNYASLDQGAFTRYNDGVAGSEDIWAFAKTLDITTGKLGSNNTWAGVQTFTRLTSDTPLFKSTVPLTGSTARDQIWENITSSTGSGQSMRMYAVQGGSFEITFNARWNETTNLWVTDDTGGPATRFKYMVGVTSPSYKQAIIPTPAATFADAVWDGGGLKSVALSSGFLSTTLDTSFAVSVQDDLAGAGVSAHYKGMMGVGPGLGGTVGCPRFYGTIRGVVASSDDIGAAITVNAIWNTVSTVWGPDVSGQPATKVMVNKAGLKIQTKTNPTGPYADNAWDKTVGIKPNSDGDIEYHTAVSRDKRIPLYSGMSTGLWVLPSLPSVPYISCSTDLGLIQFPIKLPAGVQVTRIRLRTEKGNADQMQFIFGKRVFGNFTLGSASAPTDTVINSVAGSTSTGIRNETAGDSLTEVIDPFSDYYLAVKATSSASSDTNYIYGIQILYIDNSPAGR